MFFLVPAYPGCPGSKAVKRSVVVASTRRITVTLAMHRVHDCMLRLPEIHLKEQFMAQLANVAQHTTHTHAHAHPFNGPFPGLPG